MAKKTGWNPEQKQKTLSERGADHRRAIYASTRPYKRQHIVVEARQRVNALLDKNKGKRSPDERWATAGEAAAILIEAQAALDRLDAGAVE